MDIEQFRNVLLAGHRIEECFPFDDVSPVYKVGGKIFAILSLSEEPTVNLKCNPELAIDLRERYPDHVLPGYHMNKKHWNTVILVGPYGDGLLRSWVEHSYNLVFDSLPKKLKEELSLDKL